MSSPRQPANLGQTRPLPFPRKMPLLWAGVMGQVEMGQEELSQKSLGCQLEGVSETS